MDSWSPPEVDKANPMIVKVGDRIVEAYDLEETLYNWHAYCCRYG